MEPMASPYQQEIDVMRSLARQAGRLALRHFRGASATEEKADHSPVTAADRECEQLI